MVERSATVLGGKEEKVVADAGQRVGVATGSREFSLGGSIFSLKLIFRAGREATEQQV